MIILSANTSAYSIFDDDVSAGMLIEEVPETMIKVTITIRSPDISTPKSQDVGARRAGATSYTFHLRTARLARID